SVRRRTLADPRRFRLGRRRARDPRLPLEARAHAVRAHAHRDHARAPLAPRRAGDAQAARAQRRRARARVGGRGHQRRAGGAPPVPPFPLVPYQLIPFRIGALLNRPKHVPCAVDRELLNTGDEMVGPLEVIPTPGHTPGSVSFFWRERGVLAVGDAIATWPLK